jgi:hypothetical protein
MIIASSGLISNEMNEGSTLEVDLGTQAEQELD